MPAFAYVARNTEGQRVTGTLTAQTERDAISQLSTKSLFPLEVGLDKPKRKFSLGGGRVSGQILSTTYSQMASLLRSGVPLLRTLKILEDQSSNARLSATLEDVHHRVEDGETLGDSMARHERVFGELAVSMVRAGGEGGFLEDALERVAAFTEQQEDLKSRTTGAMAYPVFLAVVGAIVLSGLLIFFVPNFAPIFDDLRKEGELPAMTDYLLATSDFFSNYWYILLAGVIFGLIFLTQYSKTKEGRYRMDFMKLKTPMVGGIFQSLAVARFCRVLGTLLQNGVPILRSLDISRDACGNKILSEAIENAAENISSGEALAQPLAKSGHFPRTVCEMISVAEEANTLDKVLIQISDGLEKRTERKLDLVVKLLEPIMLLILASVILCVVIALLLPILKMSSTV